MDGGTERQTFSLAQKMVLEVEADDVEEWMRDHEEGDDKNERGWGVTRNREKCMVQRVKKKR